MNTTECGVDLRDDLSSGERRARASSKDLPFIWRPRKMTSRLTLGTRCSQVRGVSVAAALAVALAAGGGVAQAQGSASTPLTLAKIFQDGAVLQRGVGVPIRGTAAPGSNITVMIGGRSARATAAADGRWRAVIPAMQAGGPFELVAKSGNAERTVHDVMIGDVWLASGQSNMEWVVRDAINGASEVASASDRDIRAFKVPHAWGEQPADTLPGGTWNVGDPAHVGAFSAVAYFFARDLRKSVHVPIGIVDVSWGGSAIETWLSAQASGLDSAGVAAIMAKERDYDVERRATLQRKLGGIPTTDSGLVDGVARWADPAFDDAAWRAIKVPGAWERDGLEGLDGTVWYRARFDLSAAEAANGASLVLGTIDDDDMSWVNGVQVGSTRGYNVPRRYALPASALRAGRNVLAVRVVDGTGDGGITGGNGAPYVEAGGERRALGGWRLRVGVANFGTDEQHINKIPVISYNKMVHPLLDFPIAGVLWYQGESNANDMLQARKYAAQFTTLIESWRREWRGTRRDLPFFWVQLANYGTVDSTPPLEAPWATVRQAQTAAQKLPMTGEVVTIDIGTADDIHPRNKQEVGRRMALVARRVVYGAAALESKGPTYRSHAVQGSRVTVRFSHAASGLMGAGADGRVQGFAVAGADHVFHWGDARIEGSSVIVSSDAVPRPVAVRYAWSNSPVGLTLQNRERLPAVPFRTDSW